jgi:hypothetical protein
MGLVAERLEAYGKVGREMLDSNNTISHEHL